MTNIVLDINILMSALIKDSLTREIIAKMKHQLWVPDTAYDKLLKYRKYIIKKANSDPKALDSLIRLLFGYIEIIPGPDIEKHLDQAKTVMDKIDPEDTIFIACAFSLPDSVIWSDDKHLKKQDLVKVYTTKEILRLL